MTPEEHRAYQEYERVLDKDFATPDQINAAWGAYVAASRQADQKIAEEQAEAARQMRYIAQLRTKKNREEEQARPPTKSEHQVQLEIAQLQLERVRQEKAQRAPFAPPFLTEEILRLEDKVADLQWRMSIVPKITKP